MVSGFTCALGNLLLERDLGRSAAARRPTPAPGSPSSSPAAPSGRAPRPTTHASAACSARAPSRTPSCSSRSGGLQGQLRVLRILARLEGAQASVVVGRGRVERLMAAAGLVGAKRRGRAWKTLFPAPTATGGLTWSTGSSAPSAPTRCGSPTSPISGAGRAPGSSASSSMSSRAARRLAACLAHRTDLVLDALKMARGTRAHGPTSSSCTIPIAARRPGSRGRRNTGIGGVRVTRWATVNSPGCC